MLDEAQAVINIAGRNISNLRNADDTTLRAESEKDTFVACVIPIDVNSMLWIL